MELCSQLPGVRHQGLCQLPRCVGCVGTREVVSQLDVDRTVERSAVPVGSSTIWAERDFRVWVEMSGCVDGHGRCPA